MSSDGPISSRLDTSSTTLSPHLTGSISNTSNSSDNQAKDRVASKVRPSRIRPDFRIDSYSINNPPPLRSRKDGIPRCALGYAADPQWLVKYAKDHSLSLEEADTDRHHRSNPYNDAVLYLLHELQQELYCSRPDDHTILIIFYSGTNSSAASLKRALNPERITFVQKVLGIDKPLTWIIAT